MINKSDDEAKAAEMEAAKERHPSSRPNLPLLTEIAELEAADQFAAT